MQNATKTQTKNELEIMEKELEIIASAWDLTINHDKSGIIYLTGFDDEEEAAYIINAEKLNGNTLARYKGGITLVEY